MSNNFSFMMPITKRGALDKAAEAEGLSRSALLRTIVKRYLREREK
jgi:metal-responsive CopG/Arc/MetJ family transcriptional regulator